MAMTNIARAFMPQEIWPCCRCKPRGYWISPFHGNGENTEKFK